MAQKLSLFILLLFLQNLAFGQYEPIQPYADLGIKVKVLTLTEGKYQEFIPNDTLVRMGSVMFNTITKQVVELLDEDSLAQQKQVDLTSRFLSVDPIGRKYPELSPYQFASNRPIDGIDLDGLEWKFSISNDGNCHITVNVDYTETGDNPLPNNLNIEDYKQAINKQFNKTFQESSNGKITGSVTFNGGNEVEIGQIIPDILLTKEKRKVYKKDPNDKTVFVVAGTTWDFINSDLYDIYNNYNSLEKYGLDVVHELFHTLKLEHPFESTQGTNKDDELYLSNDKQTYLTTPNTDCLIDCNIMMYNFKAVDGVTLKDKWAKQPGQLLTKGQIDYILNEVKVQSTGEGVKNKMEYYENETKGTPVQTIKN